MQVEYCPNCVSEMIPEKKKIGRVSNWLVCTSCGLRERPQDHDISPSTIDVKLRNNPELEDLQNEYYNN